MLQITKQHTQREIHAQHVEGRREGGRRKKIHTHGHTQRGKPEKKRKRREKEVARVWTKRGSVGVVWKQA